MSYDPEQYLEDHRVMWGRFMKLTVYSVAGVIVTIVLMALFLL